MRSRARREQLSAEEKARRERQRISVGGFTAFSISLDSSLVLLSLSGKLYVLDRASGGVRELATGAGTIVDPKFSPDSKSVAYVRDHDVCVFDLATGQEHAVTTGGTEKVSHGLAEFVAQEEMARFSGYWWSPDSRSIAYQESDASKVETWYPADPAQPGNPPSPVFYPRPGKENVAVRVGVTSADGAGKTVWLDYDRAKYSYLGKVTWKKEGPLTLTVLSRDQRDLALLKAEPETGETSVLLTEHDDAWVNLEQDVPIWLSTEDGGGFLWTSERDGWRSLEWHEATGRMIKDYRMDRDDNLRTVAGVAGGRVYMISSNRTPFYSFLWGMMLDGKPFAENAALLSEKAGLAQASFGENKVIFTEQEQTLGQMPRTTVRRVGDNATIGELPSVAVEPSVCTKGRVRRG